MLSYAPYIKWIDSQSESLLSRTKRWAAVNTFSTNLKGLAILSKSLDEDFKLLKGESSWNNLSVGLRYESDGSFKEFPLEKAFTIRKRSQAPIQILLGGHYDTVFPPSSPFQQAEETPHGILKGPGVADMKGGLSILLTVLEAFERSPFAERIGWEVLITPDEEIGSPGSQHFYRSAALRHQAALLFEPSFPDGAFVSERQGSATYTVAIRGQAAHVGRNFHEGRSAVFALARFIRQIEDFQNECGLRINVADVEGKGPVNIVPPLASCKVNFRSQDPAVFDLLLPHMRMIAQQIEQEGVQIEIVQNSLRPPKPFDDATRSLFDAYRSCASELNIPFSYRATGGVCDGNILAEAGLPTIDTAGAVGGCLHTVDEYILIRSLVERSKLATLFLFKVAAGEIRLNKQEAI